MVREKWDKITNWFSLWFKTFPFLLSIENSRWEKNNYSPPKVALLNKLLRKKEDNKRNYQLFLRPHALFYWFVTYYVVSCASFIPYYFACKEYALYLFSAITIFYFSIYYLTYCFHYKKSILNRCWNETTDTLYKWFEEVPQKVDIPSRIINKQIKVLNKLIEKGGDKSTKMEKEELKSLKIWKKGRKKYFSFRGNIRSPMYNLPASASAQKSIMLAGTLDYYARVSEGKFLGKSNILILWFLPSITSFLCTSLFITYDLLTWDCSSSYLPSKYAIIPSLSWFVLTLMYLKWSAINISFRKDDELLYNNQNYIDIPAMIRGYMKIPLDFYKKYTDVPFQTSVIIAFSIVFSVQIFLVVAIHNVCSI